jgi:hypothetical protein
MVEAAAVISKADSGAKGCEDTALVAWDAVLLAISTDIVNVAEWQKCWPESAVTVFV